MIFPEIEEARPLPAAFSSFSLWEEFKCALSGNSSQVAYSTASMACFVPFAVDKGITVYQIVCQAGSSLPTGNLDAGIYDYRGQRIVSGGGQAWAGAVSTNQTVNFADTVLPGGHYYYMAFVSDTTTGTMMQGAPSGLGPMMSDFGIKQLASAYPLPADASAWVAWATVRYPLFFLYQKGVAIAA